MALKPKRRNWPSRHIFTFWFSDELKRIETPDIVLKCTSAKILEPVKANCTLATSNKFVDVTLVQTL